MSDAFVDTTILTDLLLQSGAPRRTARQALARFDRTLLPVYAIKEFKAGPLKNFVWLHNKLVELDSFAKAMNALQRMSRSPHRYITSTAIQALSTSVFSSGRQQLQSLVGKYGGAAQWDAVQRDEYRIAIRTAVYKAWRQRRNMTTQTVEPLSCYLEVDPREERGMIVLDNTRCDAQPECCLGRRLAREPEQLRALKLATDQIINPEHQRRSRALREIIRKPKAMVSERACRDLGDAYFAFFCPASAVILTTNIRDHEPLAQAVGKRAETP